MIDDNQNNNATAATARDTDENNTVDSKGTDQEAAVEMLKKLRNAGFEGSDEKFALALGRPREEVTKLISGDEPVDDDIVMKVRGIATQRGVSIE